MQHDTSSVLAMSTNTLHNALCITLNYCFLLLCSNTTVCSKAAHYLLVYGSGRVCSERNGQALAKRKRVCSIKAHTVPPSRRVAVTTNFVGKIDLVVRMTFARAAQPAFDNKGNCYAGRGQTNYLIKLYLILLVVHHPLSLSFQT